MKKAVRTWRIVKTPLSGGHFKVEFIFGHERDTNSKYPACKVVLSSHSGSIPVFDNMRGTRVSVEQAKDLRDMVDECGGKLPDKFSRIQNKMKGCKDSLAQTSLEIQEIIDKDITTGKPYKGNTASRKNPFSFHSR